MEKSTFNAAIVTCLTDFPDNEEWLDQDTEEQLGLNDDEGEGDAAVSLVLDTKDRLGNLFRANVRMGNRDKYAVSKTGSIRYSEKGPLIFLQKENMVVYGCKIA